MMKHSLDYLYIYLFISNYLLILLIHPSHLFITSIHPPPISFHHIYPSNLSSNLSIASIHHIYLSIYLLPSALIFIDKYTQVPRILKPIVQCIDSLPRLVEDTAFHSYVSQEWVCRCDDDDGTDHD